MTAPAPVPVLPDTTRATAYAVVAPNVGPFAVPFALYGDGTDYGAWVEVWMDGTQLTAVADWTLSSPSGSLAALARPITDAVVTLTTTRTGSMYIVGARRPRRLAQFSEGRGVTARDENQTYTDVIATQREDWDMRSRLIRGVPSDSFPVLTLAARAGTVLGFDAFGALSLLAASAGSPPIVSLSNGLIFDTRGLAALATIPGTTTFVQTAGYTAVGDGGAALYKVVGAPTVTGAFQTANGMWLQLVPQYLTPEMLGASNAAVDNFTALQAALNVAAQLAIPLNARGLYKVSDALVVPEHVRFDGGSMWATEIRSTAAGKPCMVLVGAAGGRNCHVSNMSVTHTGTVPTLGATCLVSGHGIVAPYGGNYHTIENVYAADNYNNFELGPVGIATIRGCRSVLAYGHAYKICDSAIATGPLQWVMIDNHGEACDGNVVLIQASFGQCAFGSISGLRTFANGGCAIKVLGTALTPVTSLNFSNLFLGGDNCKEGATSRAEIYIDSYWTTSEIQITDFYIEIAGVPWAGRSGVSVQNTTAKGIIVTANNGAFSAVNGRIAAIQHDGIDTAATVCRLTNVKLATCGLSGTGSGVRNGTVGKKLRMSMCGSKDNANYGIVGGSGADVVWSIVDFSGNALADQNYGVPGVTSWP